MKHRQDKRRIVEKQFDLLNVKKFKYINGFDGKQFLEKSPTVQKLMNNSGLHSLKFNLNKVKNGAKFGCLISHMMAHKYIMDSRIEGPVLILEDDFIADGNAFQQIEKDFGVIPADWGMYYAGHCEGKWTCERYIDKAQNICLSKNSSNVACTHSYLINGYQSAQILYEAANTNDPPLADMFAQSTSLKRFARYPSLFGQQRNIFRNVNDDITSGGGSFTPLQNTTIVEILKTFK